MYDSISVQNDSKEAFRRLWQTSSLHDTIGGVDGGDASEQIPEGSPLELAEVQFTTEWLQERKQRRAVSCSRVLNLVLRPNRTRIFLITARVATVFNVEMQFLSLNIA